jgi:hypothetical protein
MRIRSALIIALFASLALPVWAQSPNPTDAPAKSASAGDQKGKDEAKDDKTDKEDKNNKDDKKGKDHKKHNHKHKE